MRRRQCCAPERDPLFAAEASRRAHNTRTVGRNWSRLVGRGDQFGRGSRFGEASQILFLKHQGALQKHLYLRATRNVDIGVACEKRDDADGGKSDAEARETALNGMTGGGATNGPDTRARRKRDFRCLARVAALIAVLLNGSLTIVHHGLVF